MVAVSVAASVCACVSPPTYSGMLRLPFLCLNFLNGHDTGEAGLVFEVLIGADDGAVFNDNYSSPSCCLKRKCYRRKGVLRVVISLLTSRGRLPLERWGSCSAGERSDPQRKLPQRCTLRC